MVLDELLYVIQTMCCKQHKIAELNNFDSIAKRSGIPADRLPLYLEMLQSYGLIKYAENPPYVYLTTKGREWKGSVKDLEIKRTGPALDDVT